MDRREQGTRRVAALTLGIAAAGVVGAVTVGGVAYAHAQEAKTATGTEQSTDDSKSNFPSVTREDHSSGGTSTNTNPGSTNTNPNTNPNSNSNSGGQATSGGS